MLIRGKRGLFEMAQSGLTPFSYNSQYIKQYLTGVEDAKRKTSEWFQSQGIFEEGNRSGGWGDGDTLYCAVLYSEPMGGSSPSNRLHVGMIGVGGQGTWDMRGFLDKPEALVVAVCDIDVKHQKAAKAETDLKYGNSDCKTYLDFRDVIARNDIDIIATAIPDHWHSIPAIMATEAGKDIYGQKPLARTIKEGGRYAMR